MSAAALGAELVNASASYLLIASAAATPSPSPTSNIPEDAEVTPGLIGFLTMFAIMVVTVLLVIDMIRRTRRVNYRAEIRERLEVEKTERDEADRSPVVE